MRRTLSCLAALLTLIPAHAGGPGPDLLPDIPEGNLVLHLEPVTSVAPSRAVDIVFPHDGSDRMFIVSPEGVIRIYKNGQLLPVPFIDTPAVPTAIAMANMVFHPDFSNNGKLYLVTGEAVPNGETPHYSPPQNDAADAFDNLLLEYRVSTSNPDTVDLATRRELLRVHQAQLLHDFDDLLFGHDGYLYLSLGDGGDTRQGAPTHYNTTAQDTTLPFGGVLRIDVDTTGTNGRYGIPAGNPFAGGTGGNAPEIFAWGLRNPWRMTADRLTGEIYAASNGDFTIEAIYRIESGRNYGWDVKEGSFLWDPISGVPTVDPTPDPQYTLPLAEYDHDSGFGSIIGGHVYRGTEMPELYGKYLFTDWKAGRIGVMDPLTGNLELVGIDSGGAALVDRLAACWGEDEDGELYLGQTDGQVFRVRQAALPGEAGSVGPSLRVGKAGNGDLTLQWNPSCLSDPDYAVYHGVIGQYDNRQPWACSTAGQTGGTIALPPDDRYYLVVPRNAIREGSYGNASNGAPRAPAAAACAPRLMGACPGALSLSDDSGRP